ncbi:MAG: TonB-dependent receptor plug domain-containing protein [Marinoscillum sp.]
MKFCAVTFIIFLIISIDSTAQNTLTVSVLGEQDEQLMGATISTDKGHFVITNQDGKATISCSCEELVVLISHVGYLDFKENISTRSDQTIRMQLSDQQLEEITVQSQSSEAELRESSSRVVFNLESKAHLPYLLGEQDPIKFIQTQSGVSTGTDGNNGYYVRGGGIDQNAIELDHMEFYNTNHLFGFFSMFSADAIERAEFLKAGYPAQVGGRLSSTLKLYTIDPNREKLEGSIGIGILAANLNLQVPVIKNRSGLMISYRRSYLDLITQNILEEDHKIRRSTDYRFSDLIVKYQHQLAPNSAISFTGFMGGDQNDFQSSRTFSNQIEWRTWSAGANWKWLISPTTDLEVYSNIGTFDQNFSAQISTYGIDLSSYIQNWKSGFVLYNTSGAHELAFGGNWINRGFRPSQVDLSTGDNEFTLDEASMIHTSEWAVSFDDSWVVNSRLRIGGGLRFSGFLQWGPFDRFDGSEPSLDSIHFSSGDVVQSYFGLEPRVHVNYLLNSEASFKWSYDRTYQYIHLSPLSSVSLPTDLWVPSTSRVRPQNAHQLTFGYYHVVEKLPINFSIEAFGKLLKNQVEWRNGAIAGYSDSPNFDDDFIFGKGHSYGLELSVRKSKGSVTGEVNYTLSRTKRKFDEVNAGKTFPAKYDRIHDLNVVGSYHYHQWMFSGLLKLASGTALTLPTAKYLIGERVISEYSERNALRMPIYHRLDLSATLTPSNHPNSQWVFSVYNVYNRRNPYFIYFDVQGSVEDYSLDINLEEVSLFPVLPSISYEFRF